MYKVAVAGFGHIGRRHATIVHQYPDTELVAVADINPAARHHELFPAGIPFYNTLEELLEAESPDILHVCTPNGLHAKQALMALEKKIHVVIEKPMGLDKDTCEQIIHKALQVNRSVFVVKQNRYSPPSAWLKKMVSEKIIGEVCMVQINCYWNRDDRYYNPAQRTEHTWKGGLRLDGGTLFTQFSHFIDILYWVFGDIREPKSHFRDFNHQNSTEFEDSGVVAFRLAKGGIGSLNFSTSVWGKNMESSITVVGTKGSIKVGGAVYERGGILPRGKLPNGRAAPPPTRPNDYGPFTGSAANHHYVIENVVNVLKGQDVITANALEGTKVVDMIERMYASGRRPVKDLNF